MNIVLIHFSAVDIRYLDASLYSISKQDLTGYDRLVLIDNGTPDDLDTLANLLESFKLPLDTRIVKYRNQPPEKKCHSWSVNAAFRHVSNRSINEWTLFTRSDYLLDFSICSKFKQVVDVHPTNWRGFVTSYAYHMAFDERGDQRIIGMRDIEPTNWRTEGASVLLDRVNGWKVDSSDRDAGVWMTKNALWQEMGGLNENMQAWGLQQTVFQQALFENNVEIIQLPEFLFFHQHHGGGFRDYDKAIEELEAHWGPKEKLRTFRDISMFVGKVNDETPRA